MPGRILIVDDDPIAGELSAHFLREAGFEVFLIEDSLAAIAAIKDLRPAAVVLDMMMPGLDGLSLCRKIKNDPELKGIKIAMVTGKSYQEDIQRAAALGADDYIVKPYGGKAFVRAIRTLLGEPASPKTAPPS